MAAAYAYYLAKDHPFVDGNKRAALLCAGGFLRLNGWNLVSPGVEAADAVLDLVEGKIDRGGFAQWLEQHAEARPSFELRDFFAAAPPEEFLKKAGALLSESTDTHKLAMLRASEEAGRVAPVIQRLVDLQTESQREGDVQAQGRNGALLAGLLALYQLAEDMGYEW